MRQEEFPVICCTASGDKPPMRGDVVVDIFTMLGGMTESDTVAVVVGG